MTKQGDQETWQVTDWQAVNMALTHVVKLTDGRRAFSLPYSGEANDLAAALNDLEARLTAAIAERDAASRELHDREQAFLAYAAEWASRANDAEAKATRLETALTEAEGFKALAGKSATMIRWLRDYAGSFEGFMANRGWHASDEVLTKSVELDMLLGDLDALTSDLKGDASEGKVSFWARAREVLAQDDKQPE